MSDILFYISNKESADQESFTCVLQEIESNHVFHSQMQLFGLMCN